MTSPITIPVHVEGASSVIEALRGVSAAMLEVEKHSSKLNRLAAGPSDAKANKGSAARAARLADLKAELKVTEDLARAGMAASSGATRGSSSGSFGGHGNAPADTTAASMFKAGAALGLLQSAVGQATAALKQFGGFIIADVVKPALALQTRSVQIANASGGNIGAGDVLGRSRATGIRNNMDANAVMDSAGILQDATGDSKLSFDMMDVIATVSKSRGADPKELAALAGAMHTEGMTAPELSKLLLTQLAQGDAGSVTLAQQAKLGGRMPAMAAGLAGDYGTRMATVGSLLQSGKKGFGSVDEAATGLQQFLAESAVHGKSFSARSMVRGADGTDKVASAGTLLEDIYLKTHGNAAAMKAAGYSDTGARFAGAYKGTYGDAFAESKKNGETDAQAQKDGALAVRLFAEKLTSATTTVEAEEAKRNAVMATGGEVFESSMANFKEKLLGVMPAVEKMITTLSDTLSNSGTDIVGVVNMLIGLFVDLARGVQYVAELYKDSTTSYADGDIKRTRRDMGDKTVLEAQSEKGYWKKNKENFEYIVDSQNDPQKMGLFWKQVNGKTAWFNEEDANAFDATKKKVDAKKQVVTEAKAKVDWEATKANYDGGMSGAITPAPVYDGLMSPKGTSTVSPDDAATTSTDGTTTAAPLDAAAANTALATFATNLADINTKLGGLNRTSPFGGSQ